MVRKAFIAAVALALVGLGWVAGRAQVSSPDFEIVVDAPDGHTNVECVRGCKLMWIGMGTPPGAVPKEHFDFTCGGANRCGSGKVGGWIER
jgi:hypothetical protein